MKKKLMPPVAWIAPIPEGGFVLLMPRLGLPGWWQEGGLFDTEREAREHAKKIGIGAPRAATLYPEVEPEPPPHHDDDDLGDRSPPRNGLRPGFAHRLDEERNGALQVVRGLVDDANEVSISSYQLASMLDLTQSRAHRALCALIELGHLEVIVRPFGPKPGRYRLINS